MSGSNASPNDALRRVPKVDVLARHPSVADLRARLGEAVVTREAREVAAEARADLVSGRYASGPEGAVLEDSLRRLRARLERLLSTRLRRVINATGVVLHTNLGRAPLAEEAVAAAASVARGYDSLEIDLESGARGPRGAFVEQALAELTGAEAALVVNNNAAAVMLVLAALANGRAVIVSRGELVEIGGGFRVPEVLARSGARMVEVGTTNRTRLSDYERAFDEHRDVAAILSVHPGNFRIMGFTERPDLGDLARLARARGAWLVDDLGGGALIDLQAHAGLSGEPVARARVSAGAHVVCFSCDKVLGGPQGGAIVGERSAVERARRDPLARALRLGPMPTAALEATLVHYLAQDFERVPVLAMMRRPRAEVVARVERWRAWLAERGIEAEVVEVEGRVGGGTFAEEPVPSAALRVLAPDGADALARRLRTGRDPVLPRVEAGALWLDGRTVLEGEDEVLLAALEAALGSGSPRPGAV